MNSPAQAAFAMAATLLLDNPPGDLSAVWLVIGIVFAAMLLVRLIDAHEQWRLRRSIEERMRRLDRRRGHRWP